MTQEEIKEIVSKVTSKISIEKVDDAKEKIESMAIVEISKKIISGLSGKKIAYVVDDKDSEGTYMFAIEILPEYNGYAYSIIGEISSMKVTESSIELRTSFGRLSDGDFTPATVVENSDTFIEDVISSISDKYDNNEANYDEVMERINIASEAISKVLL